MIGSIVKLVPLAQSMRNLDAFSRAWRQLHVFVLGSDLLIVLFRPVVIDQSNYAGFSFTTFNLNRSIRTL